jgi:hypothetical protein
MCSAVAESAAIDTIVAPSQRKGRRQPPAISTALRKEVTAFARDVGERYRNEFSADPKLKQRTTRLLLALLPPRPRRTGRPRNQETTRAITAYNRFRRRHPQEKPRELWGRVCREFIPDYDNHSDLEQRALRDELRQRVKSRLRKRPRRKVC